MQTKKRALRAAAIALASLLALSCDNSYGIFQSVQDEQAQNGTKAFQETTAITAFGHNGYYFAATASLYRRSANVNENPAKVPSWSRLNIGTSGAYSLRSAVIVNAALVNATIYALVGKDSSSVALYSSINDGSTWTKISLPSSPVTTDSSHYTYSFDSLYSANNELFAVGHQYVPTTSTNNGTSYYDLYHYNTGTFLFEPVSGFTNMLTVTIRGVAWDGVKYWFASENLLYSGSSTPDGTGASSVISLFTGLSGQTIWGISSATSPNDVYITTKEGYLYRGDGTHKQIDRDRPLSTVIQLPAPLSYLLVGTDVNDVNTGALGYYQGTFAGFNEPSSDNSFYPSKTSAIYSTTVSDLPVHAFYYDGDGSAGNLFICISPGYTSTSLYGLYESHWDGSGWSGWSAQ